MHTTSCIYLIYLASDLMSKFVEIIADDIGLIHSLLTFPDINPLYESTITSLMSMVLYLVLNFGGSSMTNSMEEIDISHVPKLVSSCHACYCPSALNFKVITILKIMFMQ